MSAPNNTSFLPFCKAIANGFAKRKIIIKLIISDLKALFAFLLFCKRYMSRYVQCYSILLLSGKNHEAFQKQHFPGQPICLVYI